MSENKKFLIFISITKNQNQNKFISLYFVLSNNRFEVPKFKCKCNNRNIWFVVCDPNRMQAWTGAFNIYICIFRIEIDLTIWQSMLFTRPLNSSRALWSSLCFVVFTKFNFDIFGFEQGKKTKKKIILHYITARSTLNKLPSI